MDNDEFATMLDDDGMSSSMDSAGYVELCRGFSKLKIPLSRTDQREAKGVLTLTVHICIRDEDMIENFVCLFIASSLREKECILHIR
jgi:hypothetical protein